MVDLSHHEQAGHYLEGTGSPVCDHQQRTAYICRSARSSPAAMAALSAYLPYQVPWFDAYDQQGQRIYHTNVMMSVGIKYAIVCLDAIADKHARLALVSALSHSGKTIIPITLKHMAAFCGNILELKGQGDLPVMAMSVRAWHAFTPWQQSCLSDSATIVQAPIDIIEDLGRAGARCMLAELFPGPI